MLRDELRHLEHVHGLLAAEHFLQLLISVDIALVLWVLEVMLLDVRPELLDDLRARQGTLADDCSEFFADCERLHERGCCFCCHILLVILKTHPS